MNLSGAYAIVCINKGYKSVHDAQKSEPTVVAATVGSFPKNYCLVDAVYLYIYVDNLS